MKKTRFSIRPILKTTLVISLALCLSGCMTEQEPPQEPDPPVTEEATVWTEEAVLDCFRTSNTGSNALVLDSVVFPDTAYDNVGAVMYTDTEDGPCRIVYVDQEGFFSPMEVSARPAEDSELTYLGNGTVLFSLSGPEGPTRQMLSFSSDGPNIHWELVSEDVAPEEFEGLE